MASALTAAAVLDELTVSVNTAGRKENVQPTNRLANFKFRASQALALGGSQKFAVEVANARQTANAIDIDVYVPNSLRVINELLAGGNLTAARILHDTVVEQAERHHNQALQLRNQHTCSQAQLLGALLTFFVEGSPPAVTNVLVTSVQPTDGKLLQESEANTVWWGVIQSLYHLLQVDVSPGAKSGSFLRLAQSFSGLGTATSPIETHAVSISNTKDPVYQEAKMYANVILVIAGCRCMAIADDVSSFSSRSETTAQLMFLNPSKMGYRRRDRRKVLKYAVCLLDAFHELHDLDPTATTSNWARIQCALFAACVIDIILPACDNIDLKHAQIVLDRFDAIFSRLNQNEAAAKPPDLPLLLDSSHTPAPTSPSEAYQVGAAIPQRHNSKYSQNLRRQRRNSRRGKARPAIKPDPIDVIAQDAWSELRTIHDYTRTTAAMMNRSSKAPFMWLTVIPQSAMQHDCVRYAVRSSIEGSKAILHCHEEQLEVKDRCERQALRWTNSAIRDVVNKSVPLDAILLTSLLLSNVDLLSGRPGDAFMHVHHAFNLSRSQDMTDSRTPVRAYCQTYMKSLTEVQDMRTVRTGSRKLRLSQAIESLRATNREIEGLLQLLSKSCLAERGKITSVLKITQYEIRWLLPRWHQHWVNTCENDTDDEEMDEQSHDETFLPWAAGTRQLHQYLNTGHGFNVTEFEIAMERTMPLYSLSKFWLDEDIRAEVVQLMMDSAIIRGKDGSAGRYQ